jgi:hypothetical protein
MKYQNILNLEIRNILKKENIKDEHFENKKMKISV